MGSNETLLSGKREHMAQRKERFLSALAGSCGDTRLACRVAGVSATTVARWNSCDGEFRAASDEVEDAAFLLLEAEARRRAMAGSDRLLIFLLSSRLPHKYGFAQQARAVLDQSEAREIAVDMVRVYQELEGYCPPPPDGGAEPPE